MSDYETVNAVIDSARIGVERGCFLDSWVFLNFEIGTQGFGGFVLGGEPGVTAGEHKSQPNLAAEWIMSVLRAADVEDWSKLKGRSVRVRRETGWNGKIRGIGHIIKDDRWFMPEEAFDFLLDRAKAPNR
jgi:hypothetical protein